MRKMFCGLIMLTPILALATTLPQAFRHALKTNPEILASIAKNLSTKQSIEEAIGTYYPSLDLKAGVGKQRTQSPTTAAIGGSRITNLTRQEASLELTQNLFAGGESIYDVKRARNAYRSQFSRSFLKANELAYQLTEQYLEIIKQERLLALALKNLREHQKMVRMIKKRSLAGISRKTDLEQIKGRTAQAHVNYINTKNSLISARVQFQKLSGLPGRRLKWPKLPSRKALPPNVDVAIQQSLIFHPALHTAHSDLLQTKYLHKMTTATNWPRIDFVLSQSHNENLGGLAGTNSERLAMIKLSYNLYRGGIDFAKQKAAAYNIKEALEQKKESLLLVKQNIKLAWQAWLTAGQRLKHYNDHIISSAKIRKAHFQRFKIGKQKLIALLDAEYEYYRAKVDKINGLNEEILARFKILETMGVLLPFINGNTPKETMLTLESNARHSWLR